MCPQLEHHESAKIRLEAGRQTQVNVSSVSFAEQQTGQFIVTLKAVSHQSSEREREREQAEANWWLIGNKNLPAMNYKKDLILCTLLS